MIEITNVSSGPVRRYGHEFEPGTTKENSPEELTAYSLMEISRELHALNRKFPMHQEHLGPEKATPVNINFLDPNAIYKLTTPWIVRKYRQHKDLREATKRARERNRKAKP